MGLVQNFSRISGGLVRSVLSCAHGYKSCAARTFAHPASLSHWSLRQFLKVGAMDSGVKLSQTHALRHAWRALPGEPGPAFDAQKKMTLKIKKRLRQHASQDPSCSCVGNILERTKNGLLMEKSS